MDGFPSGQRGQTVNLLSVTSVVRIHPHPFGTLYEFHSCYFQLNGVLAQLGEHLPYKQGVTGSSPVGPINSVHDQFQQNPNDSLTELKITNINIAGWSSLVARRAHNPKVVGSNPSPASLRDHQMVIFFLAIFYCYYR